MGTEKHSGAVTPQASLMVHLLERGWNGDDVSGVASHYMKNGLSAAIASFCHGDCWEYEDELRGDIESWETSSPWGDSKRGCPLLTSGAKATD